MYMDLGSWLQIRTGEKPSFLDFFFVMLFFGNLLNPDDGYKRETFKPPNISCYQGIDEISRVERIARTTMQSEIILTKLYGHFFFFLCITRRNTM